MPKKTDSSFLHAHAKLRAQSRIKRHTAKWWHDAHCACRDEQPTTMSMRIVQGGGLFDLLQSLMTQQVNEAPDGPVNVSPIDASKAH